MATKQYDQLQKFLADMWQRWQGARKTRRGSLRRVWGPRFRTFCLQMAELRLVVLKRISSLAEPRAFDREAEGRGIGLGQPTPVSPPIAAPRSTSHPLVSDEPIRLWPPTALRATMQLAMRWIASETRHTIRAILQCVRYGMENLARKKWPTIVPPPPIRPDRATQLRAVGGGGIAVLALWLLLMASGLSSSPHRALPDQVVNVVPQQPDAGPANPTDLADFSSSTDQSNPADTSVPADSADRSDTNGWLLGVNFARSIIDSPRQSESVPEHEAKSQSTGSSDSERTERREIGIRVPIGEPKPSRSYGTPSWSPPGRQYSARTYNDWGTASPRAAEANYARQQAIERAHYEADRAMRNYRQQTSGQFGASGLQWVPEGSGSTGYGKSYGP